MSFNQVISYFLTTGAVLDLTFARGFKLGRSIQKVIKNGEISNYMVKPLRLIHYLFSDLFIGRYGFNLFICIIYLTAGIIIYPPKSIENILLFIPFLFVSLFISLGLNIFIACFQFYTTEAGGLKNMMDHVNRVLSGALIPISFFPEGMRQIVQALPFATMIYGPTKTLQSAVITNEILIMFGLGFVWAIAINLIAIALWNKSIKSYDAAGM